MHRACVLPRESVPSPFGTGRAQVDSARFDRVGRQDCRLRRHINYDVGASIGACTRGRVRARSTSWGSSCWRRRPPSPDEYEQAVPPSGRTDAKPLKHRRMAMLARGQDTIRAFNTLAIRGSRCWRRRLEIEEGVLSDEETISTSPHQDGSCDFCPSSIMCRIQSRLAPSSKCDCNSSRQL